MRINKSQTVFIIIVLFMTSILTSCQTKPTLATSSAPGISVGITDNLCPNIIAQVGQQVPWTNQGKNDHMVREITTDGMSQFDSGILKPGDSFAFTISKVGSYTYECSADGDVSGMITIEP